MWLTSFLHFAFNEENSKIASVTDKETGHAIGQSDSALYECLAVMLLNVFSSVHMN